MKVKCQNCQQTVAKVSPNGLLRVTRKGHRMIVQGKDFTAVITCPMCRHELLLEVEAGKLKQDGLTLEKDEDIAPIDENQPNTQPTPKPAENTEDEGEENE